MDFDVIIVGGAMAGSTLALALSAKTQGKMRIAVIEKQIPQQHNLQGFDARCIALSQGSCQLLDQICFSNYSLWQKIQAISTPIKKIHISDKGHSGIVEFTANEFQLEQLGCVVELAQIGQILLEQIHIQPNIDYLCPAEIELIERNTEYVKISLKNHRTLTTQLLIGADGGNSIVASAVGISQEWLKDYQQTAIISTVQTNENHQNRAFERFTTEGPLALLPLSQNRLSLVWCVKNAEPLLDLNDTDFLHQLQQAFGWRLGKFNICGKRVAYPLKLQRAIQHCQQRIALVGNATQTLHPIAGQGFNLGIRDVMNLAEVLSVAYLNKQDLGDNNLLSHYETLRLQDQRKIISLTDNLVSIFANNLIPLQLGRNLGLTVLANSTLLRRQFAKPTLGWIK
ncbi:MAG: 2-octaprenyl-6-methoxyphenyl hydroxylase [Lonepinella koalarum]|nr:2-octaprenyl-6-methoxyphenyl hydroxylase [Lonepinella koalarum]